MVSLGKWEMLGSERLFKYGGWKVERDLKYRDRKVEKDFKCRYREVKGIFYMAKEPL